MKVTVIPVVIGAVGTILKGFVKELEEFKIGGRAETIQTTALLRSAKNNEEGPGDLLSLKPQ